MRGKTSLKKSDVGINSFSASWKVVIFLFLESPFCILVWSIFKRLWRICTKVCISPDPAVGKIAIRSFMLLLRLLLELAEDWIESRWAQNIKELNSVVQKWQNIRKLALTKVTWIFQTSLESDKFFALSTLQNVLMTHSSSSCTDNLTKIEALKLNICMRHHNSRKPLSCIYWTGFLVLGTFQLWAVYQQQGSAIKD